MLKRNLVKVCISYPDDGQPDATNILGGIQQQYPNAKVRTTDIRDGYLHTYIDIYLKG